MKRVLLFTTPLWLYALALLVIDPYEIFHAGGPLPTASKELVFQSAAGFWPVENALWKMVHFRRAPSAQIVLGDSRPYLIDPKDVETITGASVFNLAIAGGYYHTSTQLFWFAEKHIPLESVVLGVSFWAYHPVIERDVLSEPEAVLRNPLLYFTRGWVRRSFLELLKSSLLPRALTAGAQAIPNPVASGQVAATADEGSWQRVIDTFTGHYAYYVYPQEAYNRLREMAAYCRKKGIRLTLVVFPTHVELQDRIRRFHLEAQHDRFLRDMAELATVCDFDYPNELTRERSNFTDPFHPNEATLAQVIREVWGGDIKYARVHRQSEPHPLEAGGK